MTKKLQVSQGFSKIKWGQILIDSHMEVKLGGWGRRLMPKMLKVSQGSSKIKWGQILTDSHMETKLGGWSRRPIRENVEGQLGVIQGQMEWGHHQILTDRRMEVKLGETVSKIFPGTKDQSISSYLCTNIPQFVHKFGLKNEISTTRFSPICNQRLEGDDTKKTSQRSKRPMLDDVYHLCEIHLGYLSISMLILILLFTCLVCMLFLPFHY